MANKFASILTKSRIALAALVIATSSIAIMPAQAASNLTFGFGFNSNGGSSFFLGNGFGNSHGFGNRWDRRYNRRAICLSDYEVRRAVADEGYNHIYLGADSSHHTVEVRATQGRWVYLLTVDRCSGDIDDVRRLRRAT